MKPASAVSAIVAVVAAMAGFVLLTLRGQDPTSFAVFAGAVLLPQIVALGRQDKTQKMVEETQSDVAIVKHRTNGPLDRQAETLKELVGKVDDIGRKIEERDTDAGIS